MKKWLKNKTVLITGASGGLGFNIAKILIEKYNCKIIGLARNEEKIKKSIQSLGNKQGNFTYKIVDITDNDKMQLLIDELTQNNTSIDVLINNAGFMLAFDKFNNFSDETIEEIIKTNFMAHILTTKKLLNLLVKSDSPAIVNISSAAGLCPVVGQSLYCATKFGMKGFTDTLRLEVDKKFYVGGVYPGFIKTDILHRMTISDKNNKLIEKLMKPADKASKIIVKKIAKKKKHIVLGIDGKSMNFLSRLFPKLTPKVVKGVLKSSKLEMFDNVFKN